MGLLLVCLCLCSATHALLLAPRLSLMRRASAVRMGAEDDTEDWREMRARLVAQERQQSAGTPESASGDGDGGYAYETPLIEQGSILLGGTKQVFGFALRQQFFHKSVMLGIRLVKGKCTLLSGHGWRQSP